ncbi:MAG: bacteriochlorophyll 4-vinyl reductase [Chloroflexales bacterium]|nr:bacteriochlorophyll 4-vinyl reductase [Chloroflexales bacterium]
MKGPQLLAALRRTPSHITHPPRIGPNSIIRTVEALHEAYGQTRAAEILRCSGRADLIDILPVDMIDETDFTQLVLALRSQLGGPAAERILRRSGQLTAVYLLQNRIPQPVQYLLKILPHRVGLRILLQAISKHAWTFVGSGTFSFQLDKTLYISIGDCVECRGVQASAPVCSYYSGAFEHLLQTLIAPRAAVQEIVCIACGGEHCQFRITFNA